MSIFIVDVQLSLNCIFMKINDLYFVRTVNSEQINQLTLNLYGFRSANSEFFG